MNSSTDSIVKLACGTLVEVERWQSALNDAKIESKIVGTDLSAGLGSAFMTAVELWVHQADFDTATAAIQLAEKSKK